MRRILLSILLLVLPSIVVAQYGISRPTPSTLKDSAGFFTTVPSGTPLAAWLITTLPWPGNDTTQLATTTNSGMLSYLDFTLFSNVGQWYSGMTFGSIADTVNGPFASLADGRGSSTTPTNQSGLVHHADYLALWNKPDTTSGPYVSSSTSGLIYYYDYARFNWLTTLLQDPTTTGVNIVLQTLATPTGYSSELHLRSTAGGWRIDSSKASLVPISVGQNIGNETFAPDTVRASKFLQGGSAVADTGSGPFATSTTSGILTYSDWFRFDDQITTLTQGYINGINVSGYMEGSGISPEYGSLILDVNTSGWIVDSVKGDLIPESYNGLQDIGSITYPVGAIKATEYGGPGTGSSATSTGDSIQVAITDLNVDGIAMVSIRSDAAITTATLAWDVNTVGQLSVYATAGTKFSYMIISKGTPVGH